MKRSIEILAHISAPSRGPDDARYRREARELLNFQPVARHDILSVDENGIGGEEDASSQSSKREKGVDPNVPEGILQDVQRAKDVQKTLASIPKLHFVKPAPATVASAPRKAIREDGPVAPQPVTRHVPHVLIERTPAIPRRKTTSAPTTPAAEGPSHRRTVSDSWKTPPSVIPDSQPTPSPLRKAHVLNSPCLRRPLARSSSPSPTRDDEARSKRQRIEQHTSGGQQIVGDASVDGPPIAESSGELSRTAEPGLLRTMTSLELYPPRPRSSNGQCGSHLTSSLRTISEKLPMHKYFNPTIQTRSAEKLERGHWLVSIHSWEAALKAKFWTFLTQFIGEGRAGWGVWCSREFLGDMGHTAGNDEITDAPVCADLIRLYCWGEVMGEIWVLLFIASERKIQGVGARWIDAMQETVAQMD